MTSHADRPRNVVRNYRNANGVKNSSDLYRTFYGQHFIAWVICPNADLVKHYRYAGIRCRRVKDELFIHHLDKDKAQEFDIKMRQTRSDWP